jgi:hypothetical protein
MKSLGKHKSVQVIEGMVMRPGDQVLITLDREVTTDDALRVKRLLQEKYPDVEFTFGSGFHVTKYPKTGSDHADSGP